MSICRTFFVCCSLLALVACQDAAPDAECDNGRCDQVRQSNDIMPRAPSTPGTISITRNQDQWLFEVIGAKGEIVLMSEEYSTRSSALNGMLSVEENGVEFDRYTVFESAGGWGFVIRAGNNEVVADSQTFESEAEAQAAAESARELVAGIVQYKAAITTGAQFALDRSGSGSDWEFALSDADGEAVLKSQVYSRRRDAINGIASVRENGRELSRYVLLDGPPRFILKARNGQEIAESSQSYASVDAAQAAIDSTQSLIRSEKVANPW